MKLWEIFRFELVYQLRRAWPWLIFGILFALCFLMARDASLADAMYEDFFANSSFSVSKTTVLGGLFWLLAAAAVAGEAAARDVATWMHPLTYTVPVSKAEHLAGRISAALVLNALILLAVPLGILAGVYSPGVNAAALGPFRPAVFVTAYAFIVIPNAFAATAVQFAAATRTGRPMASYMGSLLLVFMSFFVGSILLYNKGLGTLLDPIGMRFIIEDLAHEWTPIEKSTRILALEGSLLANRLVWIGVGIVTFLVTYTRFRFAHRTESGWWWTRRRLQGMPREVAIDGGRLIAAHTTVPVPTVHSARGLAIQVLQTLAVAWTSFRTIAKSLPGLALLIVIPLMAVPVVFSQIVSMGSPLLPTTARVLMELTGGLTADMAAEPSRWVIIPLFIVFFAGELIWRERDAGISEITDAMPMSEWVPLAGKFLGLGLLLAVFMALLTAAGMLAQSVLGYHNFEIALYLKVLFGLQLPEYLLFALLALVLHVLVDQKYIGHLAAIISYAFIAVLAQTLGLEHNLLVYLNGPGWSYTEMQGFGDSLGPWLWFRLYWAAWALLLAVVGKLLWVRSKERGFRARLQVARARFTGATITTAALAVALILSLGGFIFYNTNILNEYHPSADAAERSAEYERRYRRYENIAQPQLTRANLRVELHPRRRAADIHGSYRLVNLTAQPIDSIHLATAPSSLTRSVTFDRKATLAVADDAHGYRIYALEKPLAPGDTLGLDFDVRVERRGFGNNGIDPSIGARGTYFTGEAWLPFVGYQRFREILTPAERRAHGLEPRPVLASLYDVEGREPSRSRGVDFEAIIATDEDQVAVAPGALRREWRENGRRYFHYASSAPIGTEWGFFSAKYAVHESKWKNVLIRNYHDPKHTAQLERMTRGVHDALEYYSSQFGPYGYDHLTIVEHPYAPGTGAHADASTIYYGQGFASWIPKENKLDFPYAVMGHEMAHEWTIPYALAEGLPFLAEGLAWYYAIQLVKEARGEQQLDRLLAFTHQPYPFRPIKRGEPLLRAMDGYLAYRKGPLAMYAMSEYIGTKKVNGALRALIAKHGAPGAPAATTLDLYRELQAVTPDSLQYLLHDFFEVNTIWELETEQATAQQTGASAWQVTLDVRARKVVVDSAGVETELPMNDLVPIGVFAVTDGGAVQPLYLQMHRIRTGQQAITVTVPRKPTHAGIDPNNLLLDPKAGDNNKAVTIKSSRE